MSAPRLYGSQKASVHVAFRCLMWDSQPAIGFFARLTRLSEEFCRKESGSAVIWFSWTKSTVSVGIVATSEGIDVSSLPSRRSDSSGHAPMSAGTAASLLEEMVRRRSEVLFEKKPAGIAAIRLRWS